MRRLLVSLSPSEEQDQERNGLRDALQKETPGSTTALVALPKCSKMALKLCSLPVPSADEAGGGLKRDLFLKMPVNDRTAPLP